MGCGRDSGKAAGDHLDCGPGAGVCGVGVVGWIGWWVSVTGDKLAIEGRIGSLLFVIPLQSLKSSQ